MNSRTTCRLQISNKPWQFFEESRYSIQTLQHVMFSSNDHSCIICLLMWRCVLARGCMNYAQP